MADSRSPWGYYAVVDRAYVYGNSPGLQAKVTAVAALGLFVPVSNKMSGVQTLKVPPDRS